MKKFECEHDIIEFDKCEKDFGNKIMVRLICKDCCSQFEYFVSESDFISAIMEIDTEPNFYINGVLQND